MKTKQKTPHKHRLHYGDYQRESGGRWEVEESKGGINGDKKET